MVLLLGVSWNCAVCPRPYRLVFWWHMVENWVKGGELTSHSLSCQSYPTYFLSNILLLSAKFHFIGDQLNNVDGEDIFKKLSAFQYFL